MSWASSTLPKSVKNKAHNRNYSSLFSKSAYSTARPRQQRALVTSTLLNIPARWPNHTSSPRGCPGKLPCSTAAPSGSHGRGSSWQARMESCYCTSSAQFLFTGTSTLLAAFQAPLRNRCPSSDVSVDSQPADGRSCTLENHCLFLFLRNFTYFQG